MLNGSDAPSIGEQLSALADGELDGGAVSAACSAWREDASARATWHAFHLIGDVLRSDDLAGQPARDADFLAALRKRMADEPIVLAPSPQVAAEPEVAVQRRVGAARNSRWSWMAPTAVAAGFVVVAGALMVTGPFSGTNPGATLASVQPSTRVASLPTPAASAFAVSDTLVPANEAPVTNRQLIRDARLDRYLSAHKEFAGSTALGVPSGFLRDAVAESPSR